MYVSLWGCDGVTCVRRWAEGRGCYKIIIKWISKKYKPISNSISQSEPKYGSEFFITLSYTYYKNKPVFIKRRIINYNRPASNF